MSSALPVTILLSAAGSSTRMRGRDKLLEPVAGEPLLRRQARAACATGCPVLVTLPPDAAARRRALAGLDLRILEVARAAEGMGESLKAGVAAADPRAAVLVMLADMPEIGAADLDRLLDAYRNHGGTALVRAAGADGTPGHPVIFPPDTLPAFERLKGDTGAKEILKAEAHRLKLLALPDRRALTDLDTPEDWAAWRAWRD
ncbi:nucleotidyltransferase family protein [Oceaniglobus roseus]|uniref:nucleotidyltransferase family protein n=1 Tax=Oceaniglobus roseus TaxID=1737570 RepID=UPI000C7F636B|nr:nucleotidyltransferase family protein [Kandeliimicrobium roseum]